MQMPVCEFYFVGGTSATYWRYRKEYVAANMHFVGHVPHEEIPAWQAAADMLIIPNTAQQEISTHYTSPMKLFEYMASERPSLIRACIDH